jgi:hypothetical protein
LLLQTAYGDYQIGAFENLHQLVEDSLVVLRPRPKIFFQYELRVANCLKSQLLISHSCLPAQKINKISRLKKGAGNQANLGKNSRVFELPHQFLFQSGSPRRTDRGGFDGLTGGDACSQFLPVLPGTEPPNWEEPVPLRDDAPPAVPFGLLERAWCIR